VTVWLIQKWFITDGCYEPCNEEDSGATQAKLSDIPQEKVIISLTPRTGLEITAGYVQVKVTFQLLAGHDQLLEDQNI